MQTGLAAPEPHLLRSATRGRDRTSIKTLLEKFPKLSRPFRIGQALQLWESKGQVCTVAKGTPLNQALTQVTLPCDDGSTVGTHLFGHILSMLLCHVDLQGPTLSEAGMASGAFIGLLTWDMNNK